MLGAGLTVYLGPFVPFNLNGGVSTESMCIVLKTEEEKQLQRSDSPALCGVHIGPATAVNNIAWFGSIFLSRAWAPHIHQVTRQ